MLEEHTEQMTAQEGSGAVVRLGAGAWSARLQYNLLFIAFPHHLKKVPQRRIILRLEQQEIDAQLSGQMQRLLVVFQLQRVADNVAAPFILLGWKTIDLPSGRQCDGHVIQLFEGKPEVDRMCPLGVIEYVLFR